MKRKIAILLTFTVVFMMAFVSCGGGNENSDVSGSKYVGSWKTGSIKIADSSEALDADYVLTLNDDGTGVFTGTDEDGEVESSELTWVLTDDGFKTKGETKLTFTDDGDNIKTKLLGVNLVFVRVDSDTAGENEVVDYEDASVYGYDGEDPVIGACYKYMAEVVAKEGYEAEDASIPYAIIVGDTEEGTDGDLHVWGNFSVYNYEIDDDTLEMESGGNYPGMMHVAKKDDGTYSVTAFDVVADGGAWEESAKEIFGDKYDEFAKVYSDDEANNAARLRSIQTYVKANNLSVTKYQDEGWDPVEL